MLDGHRDLRCRPSTMQALLLTRSPAARRILCNSVRRLASQAPPPKPPLEDAPPPPPSTPPPPPPASPSLSLDFSPQEEESVKQERTGARSSKDSLSSIERKRRNLLRTTLGLLLIGAGVETWLLGREWEEDELKARKMVRGRGYMRIPRLIAGEAYRRCTSRPMGEDQGAVQEHLRGASFVQLSVLRLTQTII